VSSHKYAYCIIHEGEAIGGGPMKYHCFHFFQRNPEVHANLLDGKVTVWRIGNRVVPTNVTDHFTKLP
jgi:hypothetical protein